ncbi:MAG TPA: hypothetical protein VF154_09530 [Terriglobales bacterium]|jgi:cytochrome c-type biogenesis protein CcmE
MRLSAIAVILAIVGTLGVGQLSAATNNGQSKEASTKESRWQGSIVRVDKKDSRLVVRGGQGNMESIERQIYYDSSTEWTKQGQPATQDEFKEGSFVIVLGSISKKGVFHAKRIDLRLPR